MFFLYSTLYTISHYTIYIKLSKSYIIIIINSGAASTTPTLFRLAKISTSRLGSKPATVVLVQFFGYNAVILGDGQFVL